MRHTSHGNGGSPPEVLVRFVRAAAYENGALALRAREILGAEELRMAARLRSGKARREYLAAHALRRRMLAELAGSEPGLLHFRSSPRGRPSVVAPRDARRFRCSLSHADGIALCAVAEGRAVGADVESARNLGPDPMGVAELICSREEAAALRRLPEPERALRLLRLWTLKEAVAKATGLGIDAPLSTITFGGASRWRLASWRLTPHHVAAVAVLAANPDEGAVARIEEEPQPS